MKQKAPLHSLDEVVDTFGGLARDLIVVPCGDMEPPTLERAAEAADFERLFFVVHVVAEGVDLFERKLGVDVCVDLSDRFLGRPGGGDVAARIASGKETSQPLPAAHAL